MTTDVRLGRHNAEQSSRIVDQLVNLHLEHI